MCVQGDASSTNGSISQDAISLTLAISTGIELNKPNSLDHEGGGVVSSAAGSKSIATDLVVESSAGPQEPDNCSSCTIRSTGPDKGVLLSTSDNKVAESCTGIHNVFLLKIFD